MVAEEEGSCCEECGVMDRMVYEVILLEKGITIGYWDLGWLRDGRVGSIAFYVFLYDDSYSTCINNPFQMKPNQHKTHKVHPT